MSEPSDFEQRLTRAGEDGALIPAATVIVLRDGRHGLETLMLRRNSRIAFGGMWVFPGGRIDDGDQAPGTDDLERARRAAVREAREEAALELDAADLTFLSHWTPPPLEMRRYATWFFVAAAPDGAIRIDDGEIIASAWMRPADALAQRDDGVIELAPPTFVTLHHLARHPDADAALAAAAAARPRRYVTRLVRTDLGPVLLWEGDAAWETLDLATAGPRHRLTIGDDGFHFEAAGGE